MALPMVSALLGFSPKSEARAGNRPLQDRADRVTELLWQAILARRRTAYCCRKPYFYPAPLAWFYDSSAYLVKVT
jgi:hypothetical protein